MGGSKKFLHLLRGVQKVLVAWKGGGGQKSLMTKIFNCQAPTKVFMNIPLEYPK